MKTSIACLCLAAAACGPKLGITETRMIAAPSRPASCPLELVQVDLTSPTFNATWDVLGYVTLMDRGTQDPADAQNRELVRPRACGMGGTAVAVAANAAATNLFQQSASHLAYMVLRPKTALAAPTTF